MLVGLNIINTVDVNPLTGWARYTATLTATASTQVLRLYFSSAITSLDKIAITGMQIEYGNTATTLDDLLIFQAVENTTIGDLLYDTSKFKVLLSLDSIQDILTIRKHKTTKALDTYSYRSINKWDETHSNDDIMIGEGFNKVGSINDVYEDSNYEYIFVGFTTRLNALKYHPDYNKKGTFENNLSQIWYIANNISSIYDCALSIGINSGRPDSKEADKIYIEQLVDRCTYSLEKTKEQILRWAKARELEYAEENGTQNSHLVIEDLTGTAQTVFNITQKAKQVYEVLKSADGGATWTSISFAFNDINNTITVVASDLIKVSYEAQNKPFQESSSKLTNYISLNAVATNSNDIKKGAMITFSATDVIPTSDTSNNLESEYLSDVVLDEDGNLLTTPRHIEFNLNNTNSSACKYYEYIAEDNNEVFRVVETKELAYNTNTSSYDGDNELFDGSTTDLNGNPIKNRTLIQRLPIRIRK